MKRPVPVTTGLRLTWTGNVLPSRRCPASRTRDPIGRSTGSRAYSARSVTCAVRKLAGTSDSTGWPVSSPGRQPNMSSARRLASTSTPSSLASTTPSASASTSPHSAAGLIPARDLSSAARLRREPAGRSPGPGPGRGSSGMTPGTPAAMAASTDG